MKSSPYRGRFAPSPTGALHLGTARSALLGWLRARRERGAFILRIEDLDPPRVVEGAAEQMLEDLRWLGLDWDEGPDVGGPRGPYVQSERFERYEAAIRRLGDRGWLYPCTCSRREIQEIASAPHGDEPIYPGTCREGPSHPEREAAMRFRMPEPPPAFVDLLAGPSAEGLGRGDFVVRRKDGLFAYQLAVVADDAAMGITEVVRGDDLLASTPRQIALYRALGLDAPAYAHLPLVVGADGERLAKRHGAPSLTALREAGVRPERVVGALAHGAGLLAQAESISARELVPSFSLEALHRVASVAPALTAST